MKLSIKFASVTSLVFILGIVVASYLVYSSILSSLKVSISENYIEESERSILSIDRLLAERLGDMQILASKEEVKNYLLLAPSKRSTSNNALLLKQIRVLKLTYGSWGTISLLDTSGQRLLSTDTGQSVPSIINQQISQKAYDQALMGEVAYSDYFEDDNKRTTLAFFAPVRSDDGKVIGAIEGYVAWPVITELIADEKDSERRYLIDKNGVIFASSKDVETSGSENLELQNKENSRGRTLVDLATESLSGSVIQDGILSSDGESLLTYAIEPGHLGYKGNSWIIVTEVPTKIVFEPANQAALITVLTLSGVLIISLILVILFVYLQVIRPILHLHEIVDKVGSGDLTQQAGIASKDEIGDLAKSFNQMTGKLRESQEGMEKKVAERTSQLEEAKAAQAKQLSEAERLNNLMIGRELKMVELKKEISKLKGES